MSLVKVNLLIILLTLGPIAVYIYRPKGRVREDARCLTFHILMKLFNDFGTLSLQAVGGGTAVLPEMQRLMEGPYGMKPRGLHEDLLARATGARTEHVDGRRARAIVSRGSSGALVVLVAFFLPASILCFPSAACGRAPATRRGAAPIQDGLAPIAIGLMLSGVWALATSATTTRLDDRAGVDRRRCVMLRTKINPVFLVLACGIYGGVLVAARLALTSIGSEGAMVSGWLAHTTDWVALHRVRLRACGCDGGVARDPAAIGAVGAAAPHHDVAGFLVAVIGVLYAVVLGFVVVTVWTAFDDAQQTADMEAGKVADAYGFATGCRSRRARACSNCSRATRSRCATSSGPSLRRASNPIRKRQRLLVDVVRTLIAATGHRRRTWSTRCANEARYQAVVNEHARRSPMRGACG